MTFSKKGRENEKCGAVFRTASRNRKTAPHFRFCLSVFRLERHAVGKLCRFLSSSETVLCAMLEWPKSALFSCLFLSWFRRKNFSTQDWVHQGRRKPFIYPWWTQSGTVGCAEMCRSFFLLLLFIYNLSFYIIRKIVIGLKHKQDNSCRILCFFLNITSIGER